MVAILLRSLLTAGAVALSAGAPTLLAEDHPEAGGRTRVVPRTQAPAAQPGNPASPSPAAPAPAQPPASGSWQGAAPAPGSGGPGIHRHYRQGRVFRLSPDPVLVPVPSLDAVQPPPPISAPSLDDDLFMPGGQDPPPVATRDDYVRLLGNFHARLAQDRNLLARQLEKGGITRDQFDRHTRALDGLVERERLAAAGNGGALAGQDILQLSRDLDDIDAQILADMAA